MKIRVDKARCVGNARCAAVSEQLFPLDEDHLLAFGRDATDQGVTQGIALSQLGAANQPFRQDPYNALSEPDNSNTRWAGGYNFKQDLAPWLSFFSNGYAEWRRSNASYGPPTGYEPETFTLPNTNPYSPCATAAE